MRLPNYSVRLPIYRKKDRWLNLITLPPLILLFNYMIFGSSYFERKEVVLISFSITGALGLFCCRIMHVATYKMQLRFTTHSQTAKRLFFTILWYFGIIASLITMLFAIYAGFALFDFTFDINTYKLSMLIVVFVAIMNASLIEGIAFYERWKKASDETAELKKENLQTQLDSLKAQVNPHFLFNSLNALCSLIGEDPKQAEKFLLKLSRVYRYLLISSEENLATLSAEIQFIQSYFHLLKTRYGNSVTMTIRIEPKYMEYKLPSLTLQLLVENAVKHNIMEKDRPLNIVLATSDAGKLIVHNNLQRKMTGVSSNKIGLNNIDKKYMLLNQEGIEVRQDVHHFSVHIPLIKNQKII